MKTGGLALLLGLRPKKKGFGSASSDDAEEHDEDEGEESSDDMSGPAQLAREMYTALIDKDEEGFVSACVELHKCSTTDGEE